MSNKKISVVIATRNEEAHLKEALESVLNQEGVDLELVFVDDHSTDKSLAIAKSLANAHPQLAVYQNPKSGKCSAFNFGVSKANGSFVCIFAGDDIMPKGSLFARYTALQHIPESSNPISLGKILSFSEDKKFDGILAPRKKGQGSLSGVSPLMSREAASRIFPVPEQLPNEDTWMELAILYLPSLEVVHTDIICCNWRVHSGNSINMQADYATYNKKITVRMTALEIFLKQHSQILAPKKKAHLAARVKCEAARREGSILGIFFSGTTLLNKLRAMASVNAFFYKIRSSAFKLLSGWGY